MLLFCLSVWLSLCVRLLEHHTHKALSLTITTTTTAAAAVAPQLALAKLRFLALTFALLCLLNKRTMAAFSFVCLYLSLSIVSSSSSPSSSSSNKRLLFLLSTSVVNAQWDDACANYWTFWIIALCKQESLVRFASINHLLYVRVCVLSQKPCCSCFTNPLTLDFGVNRRQASKFTYSRSFLALSCSRSLSLTNNKHSERERSLKERFVIYELVLAMKGAAVCVYVCVCDTSQIVGSFLLVLLLLPQMNALFLHLKFPSFSNSQMRFIFAINVQLSCKWFCLNE